jgi:hypothetical protein
MRRAVAFALVCLTLAGCGPARQPKEIIVLIDGSASLSKGARMSMITKLKALATAIARGDELVIIPILGSAPVDTPDSILRFRLKVQREPYDADRLRFAEEVATAAEFLLARMTDSPSQRTDILGAWEFAVQELRDRADMDRRIVCLSDFLQDDRHFVFTKDSVVSRPPVARRLALSLAGRSMGRLAGVRTFLGMVQSTESAALTDDRREAIKTFWIEYLKAQGADVTWKDDGLGHLEDFVRSDGPAKDRLAQPASR